MTVTLPEAQPTAADSAPVLYVEKAEVLLNAVSNAMLFTAAANSDVPVLRAVRFVRDKDGAFTLLATDRYRLFSQTVEHTADEGAEFAFSLEFEDAKRLTQILKAAGRILGAALTVQANGLKVLVNGTEANIPFHHEGEFPKVKGLIPDPASAVATETIHLNPNFLAHLGKLKTAVKNGPARFTFFGPMKPVRADLGDGLVVVQMPVRIN
ncbi:hypothetical protein [Streptomyces sp. NPDC001089]